MIQDRLSCLLLTLALPGLVSSPAQQSAHTPNPPSSTIHLNIVVDDKSGTPVPGLEQKDFTVLDNNKPQPITSFKVFSSAQEPVEVIFLIDAVNTRYTKVAYVRSEVEKFLRANDGKLAFPTTLAVFTDQGTKIDREFFTSGNEAANALDHYTIGLREITRTSQWGGQDRMEISLTALQQLVDYASTLPGRKMVFWISEGWPLLSGPGIYLDNHQKQQVFDEAVSFSTQLRRADMTLYNLNPLGAAENLSREDRYQDFLKGFSKPSQAQVGDLGLQVLAVRSGGLALDGVSESISRCLADASTWYEIDYNPPQAMKPDEYHRIEVKVSRPRLTARTSDSYYADPTVDLQR